MRHSVSCPPQAADAADLNRARTFRERWSSRRMRRLNHVLIPEKKPDRDRLRKTLFGRLLGLTLVVIRAYSREGRVLLLLAVPVGCASLDVRFSQVHQLFAMVLTLLGVSLLLRPFFRIPALRTEVRAPKRVSVDTPTRLDVCLCNEGPAALTNLRVERPFLPWDGEWQGRPPGVALIEPGDRTSVSVEATFTARGEHHLDPFEIGALAPLGLAVGPHRATSGARFLVVPRVANVTSLRLAHHLPEQRQARAASRQPGETDIAGVRPYRFGDPLKHIHARTWARTGLPHVRQYLDERNDSVTLAVLVDDERASEEDREAALSLAAGVAARLALHEGGLDTLCIDDEQFPVRPRSGARALDTVLDRLAVHELAPKRRAVVAALQEGLATTSTLILISAGATKRAQTLVDAAGARNLPCLWAQVSDAPGGAARRPGDAILVSSADIAAQRAVSL